MAATPQQGLQPDGQRSGRQLWAFGFFWLAVPLMVLAGWLAGSRINRLLHWSRADAEVQRSEVYLMNPQECVGRRGDDPLCGEWPSCGDERRPRISEWRPAVDETVGAAISNRVWPGGSGLIVGVAAVACRGAG